MKRFPLVLLLSIPSTLFASGLSKPVYVGPKAIGMGGAFVGVADDPTAIYHNPAGITQLSGYQVEAGMDGLITAEEYTPPGGAPPENADTEFIPVPNFAFVSDFLKPVWLGIGVFFPHGNGGKYPTASAAPFNPTEGRIYSMEIAPAVAWKIIPELSLGGSLRMVRVSSELKGQALPGGGTLEDLDQAGWGVGGSAALMFTPCPYFSLGVNYRTGVTADLTGTATFSGIPGLGTLPSSLDQRLPTQVNVGLSAKPIEKLTVAVAYGWERNSEIENLVLNVSAPVGTIISPQNWEDSHTIHFGGEYWILPELAGRLGYAKDLVDSIPDPAMNRVVGDIAAHEVSAGLAYKWSRYTFAGTWNARFGERDIPLNAVNPSPGHYDAIVQAISLAVGVSL
ncbi:MAG TPA: outer membrane protein transport protein [Bdellovibrionota bacterium]|nr:outer membrane protein transport protein [Bdellovibrionota bacterium]